MFFIEADLPNAKENGHYPRIEVMQEDYGDHNGYTHEIRMNDAETIVNAPKIQERIFECKNFLIQKVDASGTLNPEEQLLFDFITYIEDGTNKPF